MWPTRWRRLNNVFVSPKMMYWAVSWGRRQQPQRLKRSFWVSTALCSAAHGSEPGCRIRTRGLEPRDDAADGAATHVWVAATLHRREGLHMHPDAKWQRVGVNRNRIGLTSHLGILQEAAATRRHASGKGRSRVGHQVSQALRKRIQYDDDSSKGLWSKYYKQQHTSRTCISAISLRSSCTLVQAAA